MGEVTKIGWTDKTWNPWQGCRKVSPGCKFCYMYREKERYGQNPKTVVKSTEATFNKPKTWKEPARVFVCSWSDFFIEEADNYRAAAWNIIRQSPHLTFQILTKRPERILANLPADWGGGGYPNVWLGTSVENQETAAARLPFLLDVPAAVRFISAEPLLGAVDLTEYFNEKPGAIGWVIIGGESGNGNQPNAPGVKYGYRVTDLRWILSLQDQSKTAGAAVFVKQLGTFLAKKAYINTVTKDKTGADIGAINGLIAATGSPYRLLQEFPK